MTITVMSLVYNMLYITDEESSILQIKDMLNNWHRKSVRSKVADMESHLTHNMVVTAKVISSIPSVSNGRQTGNIKNEPQSLVVSSDSLLVKRSDSNMLNSTMDKIISSNKSESPHHKHSQRPNESIKGVSRNTTDKIVKDKPSVLNTFQRQPKPKINHQKQNVDKQATKDARVKQKAQNNLDSVKERQSQKTKADRNEKDDYDSDSPNDFRENVFENEIMTIEVEKEFSLENEKTINYCPEKSPHLLGSLNGLYDEITKEELKIVFPDIEKGGRIRPSDCIAKQKLAIIIPYRNRYPHLHITLQNLLPILKRQQVDATFFVIEQAPPSTFNKGAVMNAGFLEAEKLGNFDCYIFHDVDLIPLNDRNLYRCESNPRHYAVAMNKYNYTLPYPHLFGGINGFSKEQYLKVNGNSNLYVGWGGEDDDIMFRLKSKNYTILRYPPQIARYHMIKHTKDKGNEANPLRMSILENATMRLEIDGLNTVKYKVLNITFDHLYTWITVAINNTDIFLNAPFKILKIVLDAKKKWRDEKIKRDQTRTDAKGPKAKL
ncbi:beta-1,4-N-acetylgalactosaminyltransferase bre-4 isoform X1 [Biomphalaria glabrata]|nr:beta-1,4-N-acetylgalactosaminyltransferase bre-4 isoform X1 [Biomphalaria glabrata]